MKASELRIGNLIFNTTGGTKTPIIADLTSIQYAHTYKPIPITEEWLLKFGLVKEVDRKNSVVNWYLQGYHKFYWHYDHLSIRGLTLMARPLKYVHELQNFVFIAFDKELELTQTTTLTPKQQPR